MAIALLGVAALPASAAVDKSITKAQLKAIENQLAKSNHTVYEATYKGVNGSTVTNVTVAASPPKSHFGTAQGEVINTGSATYYCSLQAGKNTCLNAGTGSNPFLGLENLFSDQAASAALASANEGLASRVLGYKVVASNAKFAGLSSTCVQITIRNNKTGKYCVTSKGILTYSGVSSTQYFEITSYSAHPAASLFQLPAGATTITLPGGVTLPGGGAIP